MDTNTYKITDGPNRAVLVDAFQYAYDKGFRCDVKFNIAIGYTMPIGSPGRGYFCARTKNLVIVSLEHEDGSGVCFNIAGHVDANLSIGGDAYEHLRFEAFYNASTRKGWIRFYET